MSSLSRNALANVLQMAVGAVLLFVLFRYIIGALGAAQFGVWSVVLATASASRLANLGLGAGMTRFVARYQALEDERMAARMVETAAITIAVVLGLVLPALYWPLQSLLAHIFTGTDLAQAHSLLPYALLSLWLADVAAVFQSGMEGVQRMDLRAGLMVMGQVLMLGLAILLVPVHGLIGLAEAQIAQGIFLLLVSWLILRRKLTHLGWMPLRWSRQAFRELIGYGANVQLASLLMLLVDPVTKALMAKFGGASAAGFFEMANQVMMKVRALIVTANQAIVPKVAHIAELTPHMLTELYKQNVRILVFVALPVFALLFAWAGPISLMLVGHSEPLFIYLIHLTVIAGFLNVFAGPAYFINLGTGHVGWNTLSHMTMGIVNGVLAFILGTFYGADGVAWAYVAAIVSGSGLLIIIFQWRSSVRFRELALMQHWQLAAVCLTVAVLGEHMWMLLERHDTLRWLIYLGLLPLLLAIGAWTHPLRTLLRSLLFAQMAKLH